LRVVFAGMFLAQVGVAGLIAIIILLLGETRSSPASPLGAVLAALALVQCALGVVLPQMLARPDNKGSALSATLLAGVLLATPAWFLMLALITAQQGLPLLLLAASLFGGYGLGFVLTGRFARRLATAAPGAEEAGSTGAR
jgi:hypothetical protein